MYNRPYLPPHSSELIREIPQAPPPSSHEAKKKAIRGAVRDKLLPFRLMLWSLIFFALGLGFSHWLIPSLPQALTAELISSHLPEDDVSVSLVFLHLLISCLPFGLMLSSAGLTAFSKTVIACVLCLGGITEGLSFGLLLQWAQGAVPFESTSARWALLGAYSGWLAVRLVSRWCLSVSARRTAVAYLMAREASAEGRLPVAVRHLLVTLSCALWVTIGCLGYSFCLVTLL